MGATLARWAEADIATVVQVVEAVPRIDGAAGWCLTIAGNTSLPAGYLSSRAATSGRATPVPLQCQLHDRARWWQRSRAVHARQSRTELPGVDAHQLVDAVRRDRVVELAGAVVADRPEQQAVFLRAVARGLKVVVNESLGAGVQRQIRCLAAFAGYLEMRHAFPRMLRVPDLELAQLLAP